MIHFGAPCVFNWCQIAGNVSMDTYECLLRLCDAKMPFVYKGHFRISHNGS